MILVLIILCLLFSVLTLKQQTPDSEKAAAQLIAQIKDEFTKDDLIITVGAFNKDSAPFANHLKGELEKHGYNNILAVIGIPRDLRIALDEIHASGNRLAAIATSGRRYG